MNPRHPRRTPPDEQPSALDILDPAPVQTWEPEPVPAEEPAPPPARSRPRRKGEAEMAVYNELKGFPDEHRKGAIAALALRQARAIDEDPLMTPRDLGTLAAQVRQCMVQLREWAPPAEPGDATGEAQARSERTRGLYALPSVE